MGVPTGKVTDFVGTPLCPYILPTVRPTWMAVSGTWCPSMSTIYAKNTERPCVEGFGFRGSGLGVQVSDLGVRVSGFGVGFGVSGFRGSGVGCRVQGVGCRV